MLIFTTMINDVDDRAFMQEVYQQNERLMYAIALKYASNTQDCEDIVHDTVEKLCKNIAKIKGLPNSALRAYVVYAVRNTAINFRKHQSTIVAITKALLNSTLIRQVELKAVWLIQGHPKRADE